MSEGMRVRTAVPSDPCLGPIARGVHQQSRATRTSDRVPVRLIRWLRRIRPGSECPRGPPGFLGDSGPCPGARRVDQLSRVTPGRLRGAAGLTSFHGPLVLGSEGPLGRPGVRGRPAVSGDSGPCPRASGLDQLSRVNPCRLRGLAGSSSSSGPLVLGSEGPGLRPAVQASRALFGGPRCRPGVQGDSGPCPKTRGFDQLSRVTRARAQGPTV